LLLHADFTFIHSKFITPLPPNVDEFMCSLRMVFPLVLDVQQLMKEIGPLRKVTNIPTAISYLKDHFFAPIDMETLHQGLSLILRRKTQTHTCAHPHIETRPWFVSALTWIILLEILPCRKTRKSLREKERGGGVERERESTRGIFGWKRKEKKIILASELDFPPRFSDSFLIEDFVGLRVGRLILLLQ
jgi:hypothetical protein